MGAWLRPYYVAQALRILSGSALAADLPTAIDTYTLQPAIPSAGRTVTSPSPHHSMRQYGNINPFFHRRRRSALPQVPTHPDPISVDQETLVFRRGGFSPPLSLLIPTFAFPCAPTRVIPHLRRPWNAPLPCLTTSTASADRLCPIIIHARSLD